MTTYEWITTFLGPICGAIGWIAGHRMRRNDAINALQTTINMLVNENEKLYNDIMKLRIENDKLRDEAIQRDNRINELELQIEKLYKQ